MHPLREPRRQEMRLPEFLFRSIYTCIPARDTRGLCVRRAARLKRGDWKHSRIKRMGLGIRYPTRATVITSDFISAQDNGLIRRRRLRFRLETIAIELNCFLPIVNPLSLSLSLSFRFRMEFPGNEGRQCRSTGQITARSDTDSRDCYTTWLSLSLSLSILFVESNRIEGELFRSRARISKMEWNIW